MLVEAQFGWVFPFLLGRAFIEVATCGYHQAVLSAISLPFRRLLLRRDRAQAQREPEERRSFPSLLEGLSLRRE